MATIRKNNKKKIIIAVAVILVIVIAGISLGVYSALNKKEQVVLSTIATGDINEVINSTGKVSSGMTREYKVDAVATVKEVFVKVGDSVKEGDRLASFDTSTLDSEVAELQKTYRDAKVSYNQAVVDQKQAKADLKVVNEQIAQLQEIIDKTAAEQPASTNAQQKNEGGDNSASEPTSEEKASSSTSLTTPSVTKPTAPSTSSTTRPVITVIIPDVNPDDITNPVNPGGTSFEDIAKDLYGTADNAQLTSAQIQMISLVVQQKLLETSASDEIVNSKKAIMDSSKSALDTVSEIRDDLSRGWTAAFDGTITECNIAAGEQSNLLTSGITLQNLDSIVVTLSLGEYDIQKVKVGMVCTITTAYGSYTGEIVSKAPVASGGSDGSILDSVGSMAGISGLSSLTATGAGVEVQVSVNEPDEKIIVGFNADVEIKIGEHKGITVVPIESIILEKSGTYVYLYDDESETVSKSMISTGAVSDSSYEVVSGLVPGDRIVAIPSGDYKDESFEVKVVEK